MPQVIDVDEDGVIEIDGSDGSVDGAIELDGSEDCAIDLGGSDDDVIWMPNAPTPKRARAGVPAVSPATHFPAPAQRPPRRRPPPPPPPPRERAPRLRPPPPPPPRRVRAVDADDAASLALARALQAAEDGPLPSTSRGTCNICLEDVEDDGMRLRACSHEFHLVCVTDLVAAAGGQADGLRCPNCLEALAPLDVRAAGGRVAELKATQFSFQRFIDGAGDVHRCPTADCTFVCVYEARDGPPKLDCKVCGCSSCLLCSKGWHEGLCQRDEDDALDLAAAGVQRCKRCGHGVEKSEGCDKMKCICGYEFCYKCGSEGAKCGCTPANHLFWDNSTKRPAAQTRYAPPRRHARDAQEASVRGRVGWKRRRPTPAGHVLATAGHVLGDRSAGHVLGDR